VVDFLGFLDLLDQLGLPGLLVVAAVASGLAVGRHGLSSVRYIAVYWKETPSVENEFTLRPARSGFKLDLR
jgi:hypothetical protein